MFGQLERIQNEQAFRSMAAKLGEKMENGGRAGGSLEELHAQRKAARRTANKLNSFVIKEAREHTGEEVAALAHVGEVVSRCDALIDGLEEFQSSMVATDVWRDQKGQSIKVAAKGETFGKKNPLNEGQFSFGNLLRGMVNAGPKSPEIKAALSEGTDAAGGFLTPENLSNDLIDRMRAKQVCVNAGARSVQLSSDNTRIVRVASDPAVGWRNENAAVAESDPVFEGVIFAPKTLAVLVKVSVELLEDAVNMSDALTQIFANAMAVELDRVALVGTGTAPEPRGVFNTANVGSVSMGVNGAQITNYTNMLDALRTIRTANSADPTAMILHPRTARTVDGLVDSTGQPLQAPKALDTIPQLITTSLPINQVQGTSGTVCSSIIAGDFTQMFLGIRTDIRIQLLRETFMGNLQVGFVCYMRADVQLAQPSAFARVVGILP
jgi:HK97 family phage major capsid protein